MDPARAVFLAIAFATHAFVGYTLVRAFTTADPRLGLLFGLLPDADFLFPAALEWPFVHRGISHSPFAWLVFVAAALAVRDRTVGLAVGFAYGSHLLLDSLSPKGIQWLFPLRTTWSPGLPIHNVIDTPLLWIGCLVLLAVRTDALDPLTERLP
ncbi:membrane-bound metal-dependent hydrolase [Halovivax asiaticus JCM 14624]|uniref:Membrane-bound metal-dependent hydrolase n=1 Tax=Halovivax asiaticus JCM 14624 TaxID=1227490 RepID=M0BFP5_9EURY|nr:metal-dependent hydrolase [Halovivax asiaticus]ELZ09292.1 membrane-bound metal-dependent hydrolase [Halovivax asiaticus JCM 14624]